MEGLNVEGLGVEGLGVGGLGVGRGCAWKCWRDLDDFFIFFLVLVLISVKTGFSLWPWANVAVALRVDDFLQELDRAWRWEFVQKSPLSLSAVPSVRACGGRTVRIVLESELEFCNRKPINVLVNHLTYATCENSKSPLLP